MFSFQCHLNVLIVFANVYELQWRKLVHCNKLTWSAFIICIIYLIGTLVWCVCVWKLWANLKLNGHINCHLKVFSLQGSSLSYFKLISIDQNYYCKNVTFFKDFAHCLFNGVNKFGTTSLLMSFLFFFFH